MTPVPHRPYSRIRGTEPSVTQILGNLAAPGLPWAAARETALFAVLHQDEWQHLTTDEAVERLRKHHRIRWNSAAATGTAVHSVAQSYADGEDVDIVELLVSTMEEDPNAKAWKDEPFDRLTERVLGYVLGVEQWWAEFAPRNIRSEVVVRTPGVYIGQTDMRATIDAAWPSDGFVGPQDCLLDFKTSSQQDEHKGYYLDTWSAQLHAYAFASETVTYEEVDNAIREVDTGPWSPPERLAIVHLRGTEEFGFYEIPLREQTHERFLALVDLHEWRKSLPKVPQRIERAEEGARGV